MHYVCVVIVRCPRFIRVQTHGCRDKKLVLFVLSNMARGFENVCEIISDKASEGPGKCLAGAVYK